MKRKLAFVLMMLFLLPPVAAAAEELTFTVAPGVIYPGKIERISFTSSVSGSAVFSLTGADGEKLLVLRDALSVSAGENHLTWDGLDKAGNPVAPGDYALSISLSGAEITKPVTIGSPSPRIR